MTRVLDVADSTRATSHALLGGARRLVRRKQFKAAIALLGRVAQHEPEASPAHAEALRLAMLIHLERGDSKKAERLRKRIQWAERSRGECGNQRNEQVDAAMQTRAEAVEDQSMKIDSRSVAAAVATVVLLGIAAVAFVGTRDRRSLADARPAPAGSHDAASAIVPPADESTTPPAVEPIPSPDQWADHENDRSQADVAQDTAAPPSYVHSSGTAGVSDSSEVTEPSQPASTWERCSSCRGLGDCRACGGEGRRSSCWKCNGSGRVFSSPNSLAFSNLSKSCSQCYGSGTYQGSTCSRCDGSGDDRDGTSNAYGMDYTTCVQCNGGGREQCLTCAGSGRCSDCLGVRGSWASSSADRDNGGSVRCQTCGGRGQVRKVFVAPPGLQSKVQSWFEVCPTCSGRQVVDSNEPTFVRSEPCYHCRGKGEVTFLVDLEGQAHSYTCPFCSGRGAIEETVGRSARISSVTATHNQIRDGEKGMLIHVSFQTFAMKDAAGQVNAYFSFNDGTLLRDFDGRFRSEDGAVSAWAEFTPQYDHAVWNDFQLFIPYSQLELASGKRHNLLLHVSIHGQAGGGWTTLATSLPESFWVDW